jgi:lipopolysaccharide export LptBFGC system permease protein LptF
VKELLQTHSLSWAEIVRLALLAEGIDATVLDAQAPGYLGFAGRVRVAVINDSELPRARHVMNQLEAEKAQPTPSWRWQRLVFLLLGAAFFLLSFPSFWRASRSVTILMAVSVAVLLACAVVVVWRGYRSNRERTRPRP